jgi:hypothetical protein
MECGTGFGVRGRTECPETDTYRGKSCCNACPQARKPSRISDMMENREELLAARLRLAFDLYETGEDLMRQNLRRQDPQADAGTIEQRLVAWLRHRPGAEHGDAIGPPGAWPRRQP